MTAAQMRWAASHDWYSHAGLSSLDGYTIYTLTGECFTNFDTLYEWAGY